MKLEFSSKDFRKILLYTLLRKSVQWVPSCSVTSGGRMEEDQMYGQTDRRDETNRRFSQLVRKAPKNRSPDGNRNKFPRLSCSR